METIFDRYLAGGQGMAASEIHAWMRKIRNAQTAGILRLTIPLDQRLSLYLYRGNWFPSAPSASGEFDPAIGFPPAAEVFIKFIPLSTHGLIHARLLDLIQISTRQPEPGVFAASQALKPPHRKPEPYLVTFECGDSAGSILYNCLSDLPHSIHVSPSAILDGPGIHEPLLFQLDDPACKACLYHPDPNLDAWQEALLRHSFKLMCDHLLGRIEIITGRAIVESFTRILAAASAARNLDISIRSRRVENGEFFHTTRAAADVYAAILKEFFEHFSAVIGPRLLASNLNEICESLPDNNREILLSYGVIPDGYMS